jgi:hypothetical protein
MLRVQVRSGAHMQHGSYTIPLGLRCPARLYPSGTMDIVAVCVCRTVPGTSSRWKP